MAILTALFAFCTLIGWCCCGEQAVRYLGGERLRLPYRLLFCLCAGIGAVVSLRSVWALSDIANGLMANSQSAGTGAAGLACQRQTPGEISRRKNGALQPEYAAFS